MAQRLMSITVKDKYNSKWSFNFDGDTKHMQDWEDAGLDVCVLENEIPYWVNAKLWVFFQDLWHLKFLRRK